MSESSYCAIKSSVLKNYDDDDDDDDDEDDASDSDEEENEETLSALRRLRIQRRDEDTRERLFRDVLKLDPTNEDHATSMAAMKSIHAASFNQYSSHIHRVLRFCETAGLERDVTSATYQKYLVSMMYAGNQSTRRASNGGTFDSTSPALDSLALRSESRC